MTKWSSSTYVKTKHSNGVTFSRVSTELKLKFQSKLQKKLPFSSLLGRKNTLFSSHTMKFDIKVQPLKMQSNCCYKVLSDLKISGKPCSEGKDLPTTPAKHWKSFQSWADLVKKGLSLVILKNLLFFNTVSQ